MPARRPTSRKDAADNAAVNVWQNRIVGEGVERADQLLAHPGNWRIHPKNQQDAMTGVLNQVGWVQRVIVNKRTNHIVDGHLRVSLAISAGAQDVPVIYVDLTEDEEALILATLDPISAMAATDADKLRELMELVSTDEPAIGAMLAALAEDTGAIVPDFGISTMDEQGRLDQIDPKTCPHCGGVLP